MSRRRTAGTHARTRSAFPADQNNRNMQICKKEENLDHLNEVGSQRPPNLGQTVSFFKGLSRTGQAFLMIINIIKSNRIKYKIVLV